MTAKQIFLALLIVYGIIAVERFFARPTVDSSISQEQALDAIKTRQINDSLHRVIHTYKNKLHEKNLIIENYSNSQLDSVESMRNPRAHVSRWMQSVHP